MSEAEVHIVFFDTRALVKRYHREVGTDVVEAAFSDHGIARMISDIGVIECYSAFARKVRTGDITEEDFRATVKEPPDLGCHAIGGNQKIGVAGDSRRLLC